MIDRRSLLFLPGLALAQEPRTSTANFDHELQGRRGHIHVRLIRDPEQPTRFLAGIRTDVKEATMANVEVFYEAKVQVGAKDVPILRSQGRLAPVTGLEAYGATDPFDVPMNSVKSVRVTLLQALETEEFK